MPVLIACLIFLGGLVFIMGMSVFSGFVLSILWGWFAVPLGIMSISIPHAIGISVLISSITQQIDSRKRTKDEDTTYYVSAIIRPFVVLLMGWVVKSFM